MILLATAGMDIARQVFQVHGVDRNGKAVLRKKAEASPCGGVLCGRGRGSVIASWLLDLAATSLLASPDLAKFAGWVSDSGEGRCTIKAAIDESIPAPVLSTALYERLSSGGEDDFADKLLFALCYQFGGHEEKAAPGKEAA